MRECRHKRYFLTSFLSLYISVVCFYSLPWWLHFHFSLSCTGEGNGNPLENPRNGGAWWAAVYGVTESDTTEVT